MSALPPKATIAAFMSTRASNLGVTGHKTAVQKNCQTLHRSFMHRSSISENAICPHGAAPYA
jgi:hypothetical protein